MRLTHQQARGYRLPELIVGAQAFAGGGHLQKGLKQKTLPEDSVFCFLERETRFELATSTLARSRSTN